MGEVFKRVLKDESRELIESGLGFADGGVVRLNNGEIFQHFKFVEEQVKDYGEDIYKSVQSMQKEATESSKIVLSQVSKLNHKFDNSSKILGNIQKSVSLNSLLASANLLTSGLNLCVTAAGFALVLNKLKNIDYKLDSIQKGIIELKTIDMMTLNRNIMGHINTAEILIYNYQKLTLQELKTEDFIRIQEAIKEIRLDIIQLVDMQKKLEIKVDFDIVMALYTCYLELNKLVITELYSANKLEDYIEIKYMDIVRDRIREDVIKNVIYKEMFVCAEKIYNKNEIEQTVNFFGDLCDYSTEVVKAQNQLLLEANNERFNILNKQELDL